MWNAFAPASFESVWYWVLTVVVWSVVCNHVLGVPYDMLWRARRRPRIAERAADLAEITAERIRLIHARIGIPIAAFAGFVVAALFAAGFAYRVEFAAAAFCLLFPLMIVAYSTLRLALGMQAHCLGRDRLLRLLARRRLWHQMIAVVSMFSAVAAAFSYHPPY